MVIQPDAVDHYTPYFEVQNHWKITTNACIIVAILHTMEVEYMVPTFNYELLLTLTI